MTNKEINAYCSICGRGYHICNSCKAQKSFRSWRTVVDTAEHYKIYLALHGYTLTGNKEQAKSDLQHCDLSDLEQLKPDIQSAIREIMDEPVPDTRSGEGEMMHEQD